MLHSSRDQLNDRPAGVGVLCSGTRLPAATLRQMVTADKSAHKKTEPFLALLSDASASIPVKGLARLIKLLEENAISEMDEAESEAVAIFLSSINEQSL